MGVRPRITPEMYASIPELVEEGKDRHQIAAEFGVTSGSLSVLCSRRGIRLSKREKTGCAVLSFLSGDEMKALNRRAYELGTSHTKLTSLLLSRIVRDDLFDAVLDDKSLFESVDMIA
jgi:hypothetical protein